MKRFGSQMVLSKNSGFDPENFVQKLQAIRNAVLAACAGRDGGLATDG